jgi:hypothetical protein
LIFAKLKVLSGENKGESKLMSIHRLCFSFGTLDILLILNAQHLGFRKICFAAT